ncbi:hypothetical protein BSKO_08237 [Bryopsis sp. KO-2023]|nr:hypothetical protein BSKO_08237 [Bryopsis sp. KO-2023]
MTASRTLSSWMTFVALLCLLSHPRAAEGGRTFNLEELKMAPGCADASIDTTACIAALRSRSGVRDPRSPSPGAPIPAGASPSPVNQPPSPLPTQTTPGVPSRPFPRPILGGSPTSLPSPTPVVVPPSPTAVVAPSTPTPVVAPPSPTPSSLPPGLRGLSTGSIDGFVLVVVFGDGSKCYSNVDSHFKANVQHYGADTFLQVFGTLEGAGECAPGAQGLGLALLTSEAFAKVVKEGEDCDITTKSKTKLHSNIIGNGLSIGIGGGFGVEGGCHRRRKL